MLDLIREKIKTAQDKDVEDKKGTQPKRYYAADADGDKMSKKTKEKRAAHFAKNSKKDDDDGSAYKKAPGDAKADTKPSQYTKQYKKMFGEEQYTDLEEGKLVGNTGFIIDTLANMVKKEVGKEMQKSREKGVVLMNKLARMIGASVSMSHKRPKSDLFIKSSYAFVNDGEPIVQGESVDEACWDGYTQKGMKKKGDKMVPNCVPVNELNSKQIKQKLSKIKGITKDQLATLSAMSPSTLQIVINQLSTMVMGEKLDPKKDDVGDYVDDFRKSDAPQFKGKSDKKIQKMAVAAYLDAKEKK